MRKMVRILTLTLVLTLMAAAFGVNVSAKVDGLEKTILTQTSGTGTNIAVWSNYLYTASSKGIDIIDVRTGETQVSWKLSEIKAAVSSAASGFVPSQIAVNDDYIPVTSTTVGEKAYIALFENTGVYTSEIPVVIATLGYFNTPITYMDGDMLVVFDLTADSTVNNSWISLDKGTAVMWCIDLTKSEDFSLNSSKLTQVALKSMIDSGCSRLAQLGLYDYLWKQIDVSDGKAYAVTYNGTTKRPYKAVMLHTVDIETMEHTKTIVDDGHITGLMAEVDGAVTSADLEDAVIFVADDEEKSMKASEIGLAQFYFEPIDDKTAYFYFAATGFNKVGDIADSADIQTGKAALKVTVKGETYDLIYYENDSNYERGTVSVKDGYVYLTSNMPDTNTNRLWVVREADEEVILNEMLFDFGNSSNNNKKNGWQTSVITGDRLVGFVSNVSYRVASIDISDPENIMVNAADNIYIENLPVMFSGNQYAKAVVSSNRIYYPLADGSGAGVLKTDDEAFSAKVKFREDSYPIIIYGDCSVSDEVTVSVEGNKYIIPTHMGIYTCPIYNIEPGAHTAEISAGEYSETVEFTVDIPEKIIVGNINTGTEITADVTNNSGVTVLNIIMASYDENGKMVWSLAKKFIAPAGKAYTFKNAVPTVDTGGYMKMFILNGEEPLCSPITIKDGEATQEDDGVIIGYSPVTTLDVTSNLADKTAQIIGQSFAGNRVMIKILAGDKAVMYEQLTCDGNGRFEFEYNFAKDNYAGIYTVTASASNTPSSFAEFASVESSVINAVFNAIDGMNGKALLRYFKENPESATTIGINMENSGFTALSTARQEKVMSAVAERIAAGYRNGMASAFLDKIEELKGEQELDDLLTAINRAAKNEIEEILDKNRTVCGIDDELWTKYSSLSDGKKSSANSAFVKYEIDSLDKVPYYLEKAVNAAKMGTDGESGSLGSGGNGSGSGGTKVAAGENTIDPYTPIEAKDMFVDIAGVPWAKDSIHSLASSGIVNGIGGGMFDPNGTVTREQFIKMLVLAFNLTEKTDEMNFKDVNENDWYCEYVNIAYASGITKGDETGNFGAGKPLSREDAAVFVNRAVEALGKVLPQTAEEAEFADTSDIAEYAKESVLTMQTSGIMNGIDGGNFSPKDVCTRAMAAKIIYGLLAVVK